MSGGRSFSSVSRRVARVVFVFGGLAFAGCSVRDGTASAGANKEAVQAMNTCRALYQQRMDAAAFKGNALPDEDPRFAYYSKLYNQLQVHRDRACAQPLATSK